ncbi:MAG TPA: hypothetical protein VMF11_01685 [Candidatus Baltobacteraceae bacterium]|nr:hypothetical protein [Candidatus Baltobacteraceae bacterium]
MNVRGGVAPVLIIALATFAPSYARASCPLTEGHGVASDKVRALADEINAAGLDSFAKNKKTRDSGLSPLVSWYLNRFIGFNAAEIPLAEASLWAQLTSGGTPIAFSSGVWADRIGSKYDTETASWVGKYLCAPTTWRTWNPTPTSIAPLKPLMTAWLHGHSINGALSTDYGFWNDYVFNALAVLSIHASFSSQLLPYELLSVPYYDHDGVHAFRLDANDGFSLYILWGSTDVLTRLRAELNLKLWEEITDGFHVAQLLVDGLDLSREYSVEVHADPGDVFGAAVSSNATARHAISQDVYVAIDGEGIRVIVGGALHAVNERMSPNLEVQSGPIIMVPASQQFSAVSPFIYVIEDRATGIILLLGIHA